MRPPVNRRYHDRHVLTPDAAACVEFGYPTPQGHPCKMQLRDVSASGLSVVLSHELPGLEAGSRIDGAVLTVGERVFRADLLVMHVTPEPTQGGVFGALVYPERDRDILTLRKVITELEGREATPQVRGRTRRF